MKKNLSSLFILLCIYASFGQANKSGFKKLSAAEKCWVIFHPFKSKKAYRISTAAQKTADSIATTNRLDGDKNGGQVDAFRHAYWMATLSQGIGKRSAKSLGKAHEKGNYKYYKKNKLEDGSIPDEASSEMDLYNNNIGILIFKENKKADKSKFIDLVLEQIHQGKLKILRKDPAGNYQNCYGENINLEDYKGQWSNPKCLISSNKKKV